MARFVFCLFFIYLFLESCSEERSEEGCNSFSESFVICHPLVCQAGNQMFQIAAASALAWDHGTEAYFPMLRHKHVEWSHFFFRCKKDWPRKTFLFGWLKLKKKSLFQWEGPNFGYAPIPYHPCMQIKGFFQNQNYFSRYRDRLLQLFAPSAEDLTYIQKKYASILAHPFSVSIHVRDYQREVTFPNDVFIQYGREYFEKAMGQFPADALFVVTSNNMDFAKKQIPTEGRNVVFIENEPYYIDFYLQSLCKHNIISNSTFSWWSAWLNQNENKIVVRPAQWVKNSPDIGGPSDWIKIEAKDF
jgi:hypothetical protein